MVPPATVAAGDESTLQQLTACASQEDRVACLESLSLWHAAGLQTLLDTAGKLVERNPLLAGETAALVAELAPTAGGTAETLVAPALYLQAQTKSATGDFGQALTLIERAYTAFEKTGAIQQALRTNVGRMHVLIHLGRHQEVLATGERTLSILATLEESDVTRLITTLVHHNRGVCLRRMGHYEEALEAYAEAEAYYEAEGITTRLAEIGNNRGLILVHLGRVGQALAAFDVAADRARQAERPVIEVEALINRGEAQMLLGNYRDSLAALAEADALLQEIDSPTNEQFVLLHRADVYQALNLFPEALADFKAAEAAFRQAGIPHYRARALWGAGAALAGQGRFEEAAAALREAAGLVEETGNEPMLSSIWLEEAALLAARGERGAARVVAQQALTLVEGHDWPVQHVYAHIRLADLAVPDLEEVEAHLMRAQAVAAPLAFSQLHYRLVQRLGHLRRLQGRHEEAEALLQEAVDEIERMRGSVVQEAMRVSFLHDKVAAYEELLLLYLERDGADGARQALHVTEQAKSRALVDLMAGATTSGAQGQAGGSLQQLQAELNAIYNELLAGNGTDTVTARPVLVTRARKLEETIQRYRLHTGSRPEANPLTPPDLATLLSRLPAHRVLAYHVVGDEIMLFILQDGQVEVRRNLATTTHVRGLMQRLAAQWDRFRAGPDFVRQHLPLLERSARRILGELYEALLAPVLPLPASAGGEPQPLTIVPHGPLHLIPFHALHDGSRYLLESWTIAYAPSLTVMTLRGSRFPKHGPALVAGVADPLIPAVHEEVNGVAARLHQATVLLDQAATVEQVSQEAISAAVLHLACHGLFRVDNPMFSALKLYDGWLTAADIIALELDGALVTLSACESGLSHVVPGDELLGLARAFLGAGAATLVVSLWLVQDETTVHLMKTWYDGLRQKPDRAAALRAAQLAVKAHHPHPYYWAPFILVGCREGRASLE